MAFLRSRRTPIRLESHQYREHHQRLNQGRFLLTEIPERRSEPWWKVGAGYEEKLEEEKKGSRVCSFGIVIRFSSAVGPKKNQQRGQDREVSERSCAEVGGRGKRRRGKEKESVERKKERANERVKFYCGTQQKEVLPPVRITLSNRLMLVARIAT